MEEEKEEKESKVVICEKCGLEVKVGTWPFCGHEKNPAYGWMWGKR